MNQKARFDPLVSDEVTVYETSYINKTNLDVARRLFAGRDSMQRRWQGFDSFIRLSRDAPIAQLDRAPLF